MDQETQASPVQNSGKSNKGMYIVIAIVVIVVLGWIAKSAMRSVTSSVTGVNIDKSIGGATTFSNNEGRVTVGSNKLPDNWPSDAPKYPNGTIQYSGSSNPQTGEAGAAVAFLTGDSVQKIVDFYKKELASNGWTIEQTAAVGPSTMLAAKKDQRTFGAYITDGGNGQVSVTVSIAIPKAD